MTTRLEGAAKPKIILDCDPGLDDMFAIFTALRYCDLVAITTVAGNVGIDHTTHNALGIVQVAGATTPVHRGAAGPYDGTELEDASHVHGETGLGGVELPPLTSGVASDDAVGALLDLTAAGDVTVVAVGPLTNIAHAIDHDSTWVERVPRVVIMGGSTDSGNVTATAEFNIYADPEAAAVVFESGIAITMAGLNLTRQVAMGGPEIETMRASGSTTGAFAADALAFYADFSLRNYGVARSSMHDPCAVLEVARPDLFERQAMRVDVEVTGTHTRGMTVCDQRQNSSEPNAQVMVAAKGAEAVSLILEAAISPRAGTPT